MTMLLIGIVNPHIVSGEGKRIDNVPLISQLPELDRGCEVTSLAMVLQHDGIDVDKMTLAQNIKKVPFRENGFRGDPNEGFVGNIYHIYKNGHYVSGYAVYHGPVADLARQYAGERVNDLSGSSVEVIYEMIDRGLPVWVIHNARFNRLPKSEFTIWQTKNGPVEITYREHSVVVTGYDEDYVYINDPLKTASKVNRDQFESGWIQMGSQAIVIEEKVDIQEKIKDYKDLFIEENIWDLFRKKFALIFSQKQDI